MEGINYYTHNDIPIKSISQIFCEIIVKYKVSFFM